MEAALRESAVALGYLKPRCVATTPLGERLPYASVAREIYPQEAQAHKLSGVLALQQRDPGSAFEHLDRFDRLLPGDAGTTFLKGIALEGIGNRQAAAQHYLAYLRQSQQGNAAQYSYSRLKAWGVVK